jgi:hypothetical protein
MLTSIYSYILNVGVHKSNILLCVDAWPATEMFLGHSKVVGTGLNRDRAIW